MTTNTWGHISHNGDHYQVRIDRVIDHPPARVWQMLTDSHELPRWLAPGTIDLYPGGRVALDFGISGSVIHSQVVDYRPQQRLAYHWHDDRTCEGTRLLRWTLSPEGEGSHLRLALTLPVGEDVPRACAGWTAHLEMLLAALEDIPIHFPTSLFRQARETYQTLMPD